METHDQPKQPGSQGSLDDLSILIVLGARIRRSPADAIESASAKVPAVHGELRCAAAAALVRGLWSPHSAGTAARRPWRIIISGGYNVGVRYSLDDGAGGEGALLVPSRLGFEDLAGAQTEGRPSEAAVMKERLCQHYGLMDGREAHFILEESSATTLENAAMCHLLLSRWFTAKSGTVDGDAVDDELMSLPEVGLLTNLFHMPYALETFAILERTGLCRVRPVYAEDLAVALPDELAPDGCGWVEAILTLYSKRGPQWEPIVEQMRVVLETRRADLKAHRGPTRSVGDLVSLLP